MQISTAVTGSNISCALEGCHKGVTNMNKRIKRYLDEIEKTEAKIAELQKYLKGMKTALKEEEENEMIRSIRSLKMDRTDLLAFLDGIQDGSVTFRVNQDQVSDHEAINSEKESNTESEDETNDQEQEIE